MMAYKLGIGGGVESVRLNNHVVSVIKPKRSVSFDEGDRRIEEIISRVKRK